MGVGLGNRMGPQGVPLLGVPENPIDFTVNSFNYETIPRDPG